MDKKTFERIIQKITEQIKDLSVVEDKGKYFSHGSWKIDDKFYHLVDERTYEKGYRKPTPEELAREKEIIRQAITNYPQISIEEFKSKYSTEGLTVMSYHSRFEKIKLDDPEFEFKQKYRSAKKYLEQFQQLLDCAKFQKENLDELIEKYEGTKEGKRELQFKKLDKCTESEKYHTVEDELAVCAQCSPETLSHEMNKGFMFLENLIKYHIEQTKAELLKNYDIHSMKHSAKETERGTVQESNPFLEDLVLHIPNIESYGQQFKTKLSYTIKGNAVAINKVDISQKEQIEDLYILLEELSAAKTLLKEKYSNTIVQDVEKDLNEYKILVYTQRFIEQKLAIELREEDKETQIVADISDLVLQAKDFKKKTAKKLTDVKQRIESKFKLLNSKYNILQIGFSNFDKPIKTGGWGGYGEDEYPGEIVFPNKKIENYVNTELITEAVKYVKELHQQIS